jgi:hypothetical protein
MTGVHVKKHRAIREEEQAPSEGVPRGVRSTTSEAGTCNSKTNRRQPSAIVYVTGDMVKRLPCEFEELLTLLELPAEGCRFTSIFESKCRFTLLLWISVLKRNGFFERRSQHGSRPIHLVTTEGNSLRMPHVRRFP